MIEWKLESELGAGPRWDCPTLNNKERCNMKATIKNNSLIVELPLISPPKPSASGKTLIVATTSGNQKTDIEVNGKNVHIGFNAYIYATDKE